MSHADFPSVAGPDPGGPPPRTAPRPPRLSAVDALRGVVMIIMPLDHIRDFLHIGAMSQSPTDLATTTPALFLTRWVTHFCAPVFVFLAGYSAFLWAERAGRTTVQLSRFLLGRGLWLIALELVVMRFAFDFTLSPRFPILLITLWALGGSMVLLAALVHLPVRWLTGVAAAVLLLHNLTDGVQPAVFGPFGWLWTILHQPGPIVMGSVVAVVGYPLLPLAATMALGFAAGHLTRVDGERRRRLFRQAGWAMIAGFVLLRAANLYGDPFPWARQPSGVMTLLSFLNVTKYPASLDFLLMTLGPALLLFAWFDRVPLAETNPIVTVGRVPLFFFVVHFFWAHVIEVFLTWVRYGNAPFLFFPVPSTGGPRELFPAGFGYSLGVVYLVWAFVLVTMYPACRWFARVKAARPGGWLSYL